MKVSEFVKEAENEISESQKKQLVSLIKQRKLEISSCQKTLKRLEDSYVKLLNTEIEDMIFFEE